MTAKAAPPAPAIPPIFSQKAEEAIAQLVNSGLFGRTRDDVIRELVYTQIRQFIREGWCR